MAERFRFNNKKSVLQSQYSRVLNLLSIQIRHWYVSGFNKRALNYEQAQKYRAEPQRFDVARHTHNNCFLGLWFF
jgi:hypothetical protein